MEWWQLLLSVSQMTLPPGRRCCSAAINREAHAARSRCDLMGPRPHSIVTDSVELRQQPNWRSPGYSAAHPAPLIREASVTEVTVESRSDCCDFHFSGSSSLDSNYRYPAYFVAQVGSACDNHFPLECSAGEDHLSSAIVLEW